MSPPALKRVAASGRASKPWEQFTVPRGHFIGKVEQHTEAWDMVRLRLSGEVLNLETDSQHRVARALSASGLY